ncbi:MAG: amino acid ABC transporter permease [Clostridia bacterium]|nr:amino acid ABC transporter permease [Clostridia bacterium]
MFWTVTQSLFNGFMTTVELFALTLLFSLPLGLIFSFASMSKIKPLKWLMKTFIWIIRGTPLMLQLVVIYYGPGLLGAGADKLLTDLTTNGSEIIVALYEWWPSFGIFVANATIDVLEFFASFHTYDRFISALVAFVINYSCYFSEIYRGGIESISRGQYEAGQVLGMTKAQVFFKVVLLQVVKRIIAPMSNEIITLVKDTSLARTIAVYEIIWAGQRFIKSDGLLWPLFYTAAFYLIFCGLLTIFFGKLEKKLDYFRS